MAAPGKNTAVLGGVTAPLRKYLDDERVYAACGADLCPVGAWRSAPRSRAICQRTRTQAAWFPLAFGYHRRTQRQALPDLWRERACPSRSADPFGQRHRHRHPQSADMATPSKVVQAEADRIRARLAEREMRRDGKKAATNKPPAKDELSKLKALSERFLSQTHAENARDPELRRAQSLVAQTISIARAKYPDDPVKASKEVEARRNEVAIRIANGDKIAIIQVRNQQAQRVREITQDQVLQRDGRSR